MISSYLCFNFDVVHPADNIRYANGNNVRLIKSGRNAFFSNFKLTAGSGKHLEDTSRAHIVSLINKRITGSEGGNDLSVDFNSDRELRQREIFSNKNARGKHLVSNRLKDAIGFVEPQE